MTLYKAFNCAMGSAQVVMAGTSLTLGAKVTLQLATPAGVKIRIVEWGVSFSGSAAGTPSFCELVQNGTATNLTSGGGAVHSTTTIQPISDATDACPLTMGFSASAYGSIIPVSATVDKTFDSQQVGPTSQYIHAWPLGREPVMIASKFLQLRVNTAATLTAIGYVDFEVC